MLKRIIKITALLILVIIVTAIFVSFIKYKNYWAEDVHTDVNKDFLSYYAETYEECRASFIMKAEKLKQQYDSVVTGRFMVDSDVDNDLSIDWCYVPAQKETKKLLILNSGLHGIEGYTGSAIQLMFVDKILMNEPLNDLGVLFIHGINPYGFKYRRKVTENNVDLNRNCVKNDTMFKSRNDGYGKLSSMLMPKGEVNLANMRNQFFHLLAINKIVRESLPVLRQAALQGQYEHEKGIFYGGADYEPQIEQMEMLLKNIIQEYNVVLNVDLHTAYGERGKLHLFLDPIEDLKVRKGVETVFKGKDIDWGSGKDFYTINGEYIGWVGELADSIFYLPMLFEFGTLNSQKTFGSLKSIQIMINENQGIHYGYKNVETEEKVKAYFSEMYYPSSPEWRSKVILDAHTTMKGMMLNYKSLVLK